MKTLPLIILLIAGLFVISSAQEIPLIYDVENTGAEFPQPILPTIRNLPVIEPLTDPFEWSDGSGRDTTFENWSHRRAEIKAEIEHYEIGLKPDRPDSITANYSNGTLIVNVKMNGKSLTLTSKVTLPDGEGPFPALIGMVWFSGFGSTGSLPADIFTSRNIASIEFVHDQVTTYASSFTGSSPSNSDPYYQLYPDQNLYNSGQYSAWAWGVSRLIDGLELVQDSLPIDLRHLAVTGCSYAGKMALFAGALDERIALTIAQESGGGGAPAWRVSETLGDVERLHSTDHNWFKESMFQFGHSNVAKLPEDHHELMAMCAPRALLVTGNTDYEWLANPSCYVSARAAHEVYKTFGIEDRFGFYIDGGHDHCSVPASQRPAIEAFVDKFLLGDTTANTNITVHPYDYINYSRWFEWWGTGKPVFPDPDTVDIQTIYFEPECATVGSNWNIIEDPDASNEKYVTVRSDLESLSQAPTSSDDHIYISFTADTNLTYYFFGRVNCPTGDDDSFWLKMDDGSFRMYNNLGTSGWDWVRLSSAILIAGEHTLTIAYRENGALLDKICISTNTEPPEGIGGDAENLCDPTGVENRLEIPECFELKQNYPNPFNPLTQIAYSVSHNGYISLKVYNILGKEVATLFDGVKHVGNFIAKFDGSELAAGVYLYQLKANNFIETKKLLLLK